MRLNTSINVIAQSTLKSDVYTTSELFQIWFRRYTLNAYFLSFYYGQNVCCTFTSEIKDYYYYYYYMFISNCEL